MISPTICHVSKSLPKDRNSYAWKFHMLRPYFNEIYDDTRIHIPTYHWKIMSLTKNKVIPPKGSLDPFQRLYFTLGWVQVHWTRTSLWLSYILVEIWIRFPIKNPDLPLSKMFIPIRPLRRSLCSWDCHLNTLTINSSLPTFGEIQRQRWLMHYPQLCITHNSDECTALWLCVTHTIM